MGNIRATADRLVSEFAAAQHGVVTAAQLREAGLGRSSIVKRVKAGRLHRMHRGVYAVGYAALPIEGHWMAAVLTCGDGTVLSHGSAAALWGLLRPLEGPVDVSVPTCNGRRPRAGIRIHRARRLADAEREGLVVRTIRNGIPVTSVPRTLEDLRGVVPPRLHRRAVRQAELAGFALGPSIRPDRTRSDLERDFLAFCRVHGVLEPEVNVQIGRWKVDFLWRDARLAVETDSYEYHRGSIAFEDDHARDLYLRRIGFTVRRYTGAQIRDHPAAVVADLREVLTAAAAPEGPPAS
jgi:very-short-patch-repair endonuclease